MSMMRALHRERFRKSPGYSPGWSSRDSTARGPISECTRRSLEQPRSSERGLRSSVREKFMQRGWRIPDRVLVSLPEHEVRRMGEEVAAASKLYASRTHTSQLQRYRWVTHRSGRLEKVADGLPTEMLSVVFTLRGPDDRFLHSLPRPGLATPLNNTPLRALPSESRGSEYLLPPGSSSSMPAASSGSFGLQRKVMATSTRERDLTVGSAHESEQRPSSARPESATLSVVRTESISSVQSGSNVGSSERNAFKDPSQVTNEEVETWIAESVPSLLEQLGVGEGSGYAKGKRNAVYYGARRDDAN